MTSKQMSPAIERNKSVNGSSGGGQIKPPNYGSFETNNNNNNSKTNNNDSRNSLDAKGLVSINSSGKQSLAELESSNSNSNKRREQQENEEEEKKSLLLRAAKRIPCLGIMFALCASLFLGSAGMLVKMTHSVHGIQVAVLRAAIQLLIYGFVISVRKLPVWPDKSELKPVMARAFLGATSITFSYYALRLIPLGDATTIRFSLPIWTLIIGYLVLGEPCNLLRVVAVFISISGVVLIAKPEECVYLINMLCHALQFSSDETFTQQQQLFQAYRNISSDSSATLPPPIEGILDMEVQPPPEAMVPKHSPDYRQFEGSLLALGSSICLSLSLVAMRLCRKTAAEVVILWLSIIGIIIGSITLLALDAWSMPDNWLDVLYILLNGLCGSIGQWFITNALKVEQSGIISLVRTFDIEVAFLYSAFLLHEHIRITSIVGSCLVTVGVLAVLVPKWLWPPSSSSHSTGNSTILTNNSNSSNNNNSNNNNHNSNEQIRIAAMIDNKMESHHNNTQQNTNNANQPNGCHLKKSSIQIIEFKQ